MDADLILVLGMLLAFMSIPAMVSAWSDSRPPRLPALTILIAAGLIFFAFNLKPDGYTLAEVENAFYSVVARVIP